MKVLIVGSGGREHAIAWSVSRSPKADKIYCAPGNAGIAEYAECVNIGAMEFEKLADFAQENQIDLTIIGMDDPLVGGIVDEFESRGLRVFGTGLSSHRSKIPYRPQSRRTCSWKRCSDLSESSGSRSWCERDHGR